MVANLFIPKETNVSRALIIKMQCKLWIFLNYRKCKCQFCNMLLKRKTPFSGNFSSFHYCLLLTYVYYFVIVEAVFMWISFHFCSSSRMVSLKKVDKGGFVWLVFILDFFLLEISRWEWTWESTSYNHFEQDEYVYYWYILS